MAKKKLCPGRSKFLKRAKDLTPRAFRKLVGRRGRRYTQVEATPTTEKSRRSIEREIKFKAELVDGESNFLPAQFLRIGAEKAQAVCRISVRAADGRVGRGTGFLVGPGIVMTNNHVIANENEADRSTAEFGFEPGGNVTTVTMRPSRLFITDTQLDFTIVACDEDDLTEIRHIPLLRNPATITRHEHVNIIQHPDGRPKEVALQDNKVERVLDIAVRYTTDTEPGSSGSPVFNNEWELVALHHAGADLGGGRAENEGIRISSIVNHLLTRPESTGQQSDELHRLLSTVEGSSPFLGFFDTAGFGTFSNEIEVPNFQGTPDFADIGFWNIEHFNDQVSDDRVGNVADAIAGMSMDVLGLTEVQTGALHRLVDELAVRNIFADFKLVNVSGSQDIAVLFDTDTTDIQILNSQFANRFSTQLRARTSDGKTAFPRRPLFARCTIKDREDEVISFILIVVHLKAFGDPQSRARRRLAAEKLVEIVDELRDTEDLPIVLGGDYNDRLNTDTFEPLQDSPDLVALTADDATTDAISFVGQRHRSLIDHIIVSRDTNLGAISSDDAAIVRLDKSIANFADLISDHVPVVFRMIIREDAIDVDVIDQELEVTQIDIPADRAIVEISFPEE